MLQCLLGHDHASPPRRLSPAERAAHLHRLPRNDRRDSVPNVHRVRVHHPGHDTFVRVHVGCRHVGVGAERGDDASCVTTREALELTRAQLEWIADDAPLRPPEGEIHDRALPGHPRRQRFHLFEGYLQVEPDASLGRAARRVVQHAITGEDLDIPVIHEHGHGDDNLFFGMAEDLVQSRFEVEQFGRSVEARHHRFEWILFVEETVLVGPDDSVRGEAKVSCHVMEGLGPPWPLGRRKRLPRAAIARPGKVVEDALDAANPALDNDVLRNIP